MRGVGPVHLVRVTECPASGQWIHNLGGREEERVAVSKAGWPPGKVARHPRDPPDAADLGHLAGLRGLGALEGRRLLAGGLQVPLARGLEAAVADAAVVQTPALPVLALPLPVVADPEPLGGPPAGQ